jgi:hypothetical protein
MATNVAVAYQPNLVSQATELFWGDASRARQREVLKRCIVAFNRLHVEHRGFIGTLEAEEILDAFNTLAARTKLAREKDLADEWRDF